MAIEAILADVGGVLIKNYDISDDVREHLQLPEATFRPLWSKLVHAYGTGKISEEEMWHTFADHGGVHVAISENLFAVPFEKHLLVYRRVLDALKQLGDAGYKLAILSDTNANHAKILERHGVYTPFEHVFLSHQTGTRKPDPASYTRSLQTMGVDDPSTVLFIDDREANIDAAEQLGLQTALSLNEEQAILDAITEALSRQKP